MHLNGKGFVCLMHCRSSLLIVMTGIVRAVSFRRFPRDGADGHTMPGAHSDSIVEDLHS